MTNNVLAVFVSLILLVAGNLASDNKKASKCSFPFVEEDRNELSSYPDTSKFLGLTKNSRLEVNHSIPERYSITVEIFTHSENGLLLYASNGDHSDFTAFYVYLDEGYVVFTVEMANSSVSIKSNGTYNDGKWHRIQIRNIKQVNQLLIDGKTQGYALDVPGNISIMIPVYVGGIPENAILSTKLNIVNHNFCGCIRKITFGKSEVMSEAKGYGVSSCVHTRNQTSKSDIGVNNNEDGMNKFNATGYSADENMTTMSQDDFLTKNTEGRTSTSSMSTPTDSISDSVVESTASVTTMKQNTLKHVEAHSTNHQERIITQSFYQDVTSKVTKHATTMSKKVLSQTSKTIKISSLTTIPTVTEFDNITIEVKAQRYADDPLSYLPVYISVAIVVFTFVCVLHLVYRKTVRMMRQKKDYGKIPLREMQELQEISSGNEKTKEQNKDYTRVPSHNLQDEQIQGHSDRTDNKDLDST